MGSAEAILDAVVQLTVKTGSLPSLAAVAAATDLSKPGVLHHFPSRAAMVEAVVHRELQKVDEALAVAATRGKAARTWLALSSPSPTARDLYLGLAVVLAAVTTDNARLADKLQEATARWTAVLERELGSPGQALLVRVLGDGLLLNALAGTPIPPEDIDALAARVLSA